MPRTLLSEPARLAGASLLRLQSDERLLALARAGHEEACAAIVTRHRPQLLRYCGRIVGPGRAEDAVQQTFVSAFTAMRKDEREIDLRPWLYRIAHNAALRQLRGGATEPLVTQHETAAPARTEETAELRDQLRRTLAAIDLLPTPQRDAVLLQALEGRSHTEVATALGITPGAARQQLHRARATLRAAVTAVTPAPLLARLLGTAAGESSGLAQIAAGAGLGGLAAKLVGGAATVALVAGVAAGAGGDPPARIAERPSTGAITPVDGRSPLGAPTAIATRAPVPAKAPARVPPRRAARERPDRPRAAAPLPTASPSALDSPPFSAQTEQTRAPQPAATRRPALAREPAARAPRRRRDAPARETAPLRESESARATPTPSPARSPEPTPTRERPTPTPTPAEPTPTAEPTPLPTPTRSPTRDPG